MFNILHTGTKQKRSAIVKLLSDFNSRLEESEKSQSDRERVMNVRVKWMESAIIVATALKEKCVLRFDFVKGLREKVKSDMFPWKTIRDQVSLLTPLSRRMDSDFQKMLNKSSEVEEWISRTREEISSDISDTKYVFSELQQVQIEASGCDLSDHDLKLLNEKHGMQLRAELLLERYKIISNQLDKFGKKMGRLNKMTNEIRISNAKEVSSLRVVSSKLMVMESSNSSTSSITLYE